MTADATVPAATRHSALVRGLLVAWVILVDVVGRVLVEPFRNGRLRGAAWPVGLRPIVVIAACGYAIAILGIVFSGVLRETLELSVSVGVATLSFPRPVLWILLFLVVLAMALLQTAAVHVSWWLTAAVTTLTVLVLLFAGALDDESLLSPGRVTTMIAAAGLIAFTALRRGRRFAWWEFAVILPTIGVAFAVATGRAAAQSAPNGIDFGPTVLSLTMSTLGQLAVPAAIAAGVAVAELSASTALWVADTVRRRLPSVAIILALALVIAWRLWALGAVFVAGDGVGVMQVASSVLLIGVIGALWYLLALLRGRRRLVPNAVHLVERIGSVATPTAAALAVTLAPIVVVLLATQILFAYGVPLEFVAGLQSTVSILTTSTVIAVVRLNVGVALVILATVLARHGTRTVPELIGGIGVVTMSVAVAGIFGLGDWLWTSSGLTAVATIGCLALLIWFAVRRSLTIARVTGVTVALLLAAFFDQRDFVSDPLGAVLGFTGVAFVLFGFVWAFLTGGAAANASSPQFPRPARVLLFLANSVFGVTVLAFTALARNPNASINLGAFADVGDQLFGTGLIAAVLLSVIAAVVRNRMPVFAVFAFRDIAESKGKIDENRDA